jgi:DNA polymerase III delta subunit
MARRRASKKDNGIPALQLRERLAKDDPAPCYLLKGEEDFLRSEGIAAIAERILGPEPGPSLGEFDGAKAQLHEILDELRTLPFFGAGKRVVVVRRAGSQGNKAGFASEHGQALADYLATPSPSSVLVLAAPKLDGRLKGSKALTKVAQLVDCTPFDEAGLLRFLRLRATHWGREFARGADLAFLERLGGQDIPLSRIDGEVRKLSSAGEGPIQADEVLALTSCGSSEESFGLIDCVGRGDVARTLEKLQVVFRDGLVSRGDRNRDPSGIAFMVLGLLRWDLGRLLRGRAMLDQGWRPQQITKELRVFRDKDRFLARVRRADRATLGRRHDVLRTADAALKRSADPRGTLTDVAIRLARSERAG